MKLAPHEFMRIAKALSDPQRCEILEQTAVAGELSCMEMFERFELSQATISHHLKELATAGLLERRKEGQFGYYRFCPDVLQRYLDDLGSRMGLCSSTALVDADRRTRATTARDIGRARPGL